DAIRVLRQKSDATKDHEYVEPRVTYTPGKKEDKVELQCDALVVKAVAKGRGSEEIVVAATPKLWVLSGTQADVDAWSKLQDEAWAAFRKGSSAGLEAKQKAGEEAWKKMLPREVKVELDD